MRVRFILLLLTGLVGLPLAPTVAQSRGARPAGLPAKAVPIQMAPRPGSVLDTAARRLMADDLAESRRSRDKPLVLVGSAVLGPASDRPALFVQLQSARECGSAGCSTSVYLWRGGGYQLVLDGAPGKLAAGPNKSHGMMDLVTETDRFIWDGKQYRDANPAPAIDLRPKANRGGK